MRLVFCLATLCLSLALLSGVLMHDLAGAKMSLDMPHTFAVIDAEPEGACPACDTDVAENVCDMDCTAPVLSTARTPMAVAVMLRTTPADRPDDFDLAGRAHGADPFPPRSTFLI